MAPLYVFPTETGPSLLPTNLILADASHYFVTVSNAAGVTNMGAQLTVLPVPMFTASTLGTGAGGSEGGFPVKFTTPPGADEVVIEATTNLVNWMPIYTNRTPAVELQFLDRGVTSNQLRYYRGLAR